MNNDVFFLKSWLKVLYATAILALVYFAIVDAGLSDKYLALPLSVFMVLASLSAFSLKRSPFGVWNAIGLSSMLAALAVWFLNPEAQADITIFASGIIPSWLLGIVVLAKLLKDDSFSETPFAYRALAETWPKLSLLLFLSFLGLIGFPISPAFLGEDLLLSHASSHDPWFALPITLAFVINGIAGARVFLRLCMGRPSELNAIAEDIGAEVGHSIESQKPHTA